MCSQLSMNVAKSERSKSKRAACRNSYFLILGSHRLLCLEESLSVGKQLKSPAILKFLFLFTEVFKTVEMSSTHFSCSF